MSLHERPDVAGYWDANLPSCQLQHLAQLGLKTITIAAFGNGRRNQEPLAILNNGLRWSQYKQEEYSWSNSLVQYHYDENDASRSEFGIVLLATNAKTVMEFDTAGGHGEMLGRDRQARTYNRTKDKMLVVLEKWQYLPFFVSPHGGKMLVAPLAGFLFSEQLAKSSYLIPRSWLVLPANQVIRKLQPLLKSLGTPFRGDVFSKVPNGGEEKWFGFLNTPIFSQALGQPQGDWDNVLHMSRGCRIIKAKRRLSTGRRWTASLSMPERYCAAASASSSSRTAPSGTDASARPRARPGPTTMSTLPTSCPCRASNPTSSGCACTR